MNILKLYLKFPKILDKSKGFTLIELLVAIVMSSIVLLGLGSGLVAVLSTTKESAIKANLKNQLNRAVDYMNEDIKRARFADIKTTNTTDDTVILTYFENASDTNSHTIEYFMEASADPWLGPNMIRRSVDGGAPQVLVDAITDNAVTFPSCSGSNQTSYSTGFFGCVEKADSNRSVDVYRVSISIFGEISNSKEVEIGTKTIARSVSPALTPPTLTLVSDADPTPEVEWELVPGVTSYSIYRCTTVSGAPNCDPDETTTPVYTGSNLNFVETTNTTVGDRWCYAGISSDGTNTSKLGNTVCGGISTGGAPGQITDLDASDALRPAVTWGESVDAENYFLYRCSTLTSTPDTQCTPNTAGTAINPAPNTALSFNETTDPPAGTKWCYIVKATNSTGSPVESNIDCGVVNSSGAPTAPVVSLDASNSNIINWTGVTGATSYNLFQCQEDSANPPCNPTTIFTGFPKFANTATQTVTAATNKRWCYGVKAINTTPEPDEESPLSNVICGDTALTAPFFTNTSAINGATLPTVEWSTVPGATSYELFRCSDTSTCDPSTGVNVTGAGSASTSFTESTPLSNSKQYCYAVRARNSSGSSSFSSTACGKVKVATCTVPDYVGAKSGTQSERDAVIAGFQAEGFSVFNTNNVGGNPKRVKSVSPGKDSIVTCNTSVTINWSF
ncbi:MAG: prepilin-type N-terminal cleavage/methylation domain-containing protein [Limnothrix sp.]